MGNHHYLMEAGQQIIWIVDENINYKRMPHFVTVKRQKCFSLYWGLIITRLFKTLTGPPKDPRKMK